MAVIAKEIIDFLHRQSFVIVSTLDPKGSIHCSAKAIVGLEPCGKVLVLTYSYASLRQKFGF